MGNAGGMMHVTRNNKHALLAVLSPPSNLLLAVLLLIGVQISQAATVINDQQNHYELAGQTSWLWDDHRGLGLDEALHQLNQEGHRSRQNQLLNFGSSSDTLWLYTEIVPSPELEQRNWFLEIAPPLTDSVTAYLISTSHSQTIQMGDRIPFNERAYPHRNFILPITLSEQTPLKIVLEIKTDGAIRIPLRLYSGSSLTKTLSMDDALLGAYFGIMLITIVYNLFAYFGIHDRTYLYIMFSIAAFAFMQLHLTGFGFQFLWPEATYWQQLCGHLMIPVVCISTILVGCRFLNLAQTAPLIYRWLQGLLITAMIMLPLTFVLEKNLHILLSTSLSFLTAALVITAGVRTWRQGHFAAILFSIAWLALIAGVIPNQMMYLDIAPANGFTINSALFGSALEAVLLSFALALHTRNITNRSHQLIQRAHLDLQGAHQELNESIKQVELSSQVKDRFLATISHEFRTPMNGVEGSLALIDSNHLPPLQQQYLRNARSCASEMTALIEVILKFSELQSGTVETHLKEIETRVFFHPMATYYRHQCKLKALDFDWHIDKNVPHFLRADGEHIAMIFRQLLDNAIKYTHHGRVAASIAYYNEPKRAEEKLLISIVDSGMGFTAGQRLHFDGLGSNEVSSPHGLGIGLPLCQHLANAIKAELSIETLGDRGTLATLSIPVTKVKTGTQSPQHNDTSHVKTTIVILVVEDNPVNLAVLTGMLQPLDVIILTASNGEEALKVLKEQPVNLVLMDCQMPKMDGFEATKHIRNSLSAYSNVPIIAVTANALTSDERSCIMAGMNDYIKKPVNRDILLDKINRWLNTQKA